MAEKKPRCSFCGRPANEVKSLIKGAELDGKSSHICNYCVDRAANANQEQQAKRIATKEQPLRKPVEINAHLGEYIIAQEMARKDIAIAVYNHYKRREAIRRGMDFGGVEIDKSNILLMGPTGTGKTHIARTIARMLGLPFFVADASRFTQSGYVGDDVESILQGLLEDADGDVERAEWGICFIDEVDKIARKSGRAVSGSRDITGEGVQQALLKIIEGSRVAIPPMMGQKIVGSDQKGATTINSENILFVASGSFAGIEEIVRDRVNKSAGLGFGSHRRKKELDLTAVYESVIEADVLEFGLIPEFLGRLPIVTSTLPLTEDEMVRILTEPKNALVKQFQALFSMDGLELDFDEDALKAIGREANSRPTGARALRSVVEALVKEYAYELPSQDEISGLRITEEYVERHFPKKDDKGEVTGESNPDAEPIFVKGKKKDSKVAAQA